MTVTAVFFDVGGVLLSNGWDHDQRAEALEHFGLERDEFEDRHREVVGSLETGRCSLADYLRATVFYEERAFSPEEFRAYMEGCSSAFPGNLEVVGKLNASGKYLLATLNNEGRELNEFRIRHFELRRRFTTFFTSSLLGMMKPEEEIYRAALGITQREAGEALFVDDRRQNLEPAANLGMRTLLFRGGEGPDALLRGLAEQGVEA
ncbi:HAD family phosphatase [soil metagenome]